MKSIYFYSVMLFFITMQSVFAEGESITVTNKIPAQDNPRGLALEILNPYEFGTETHPDWGPPDHWTPWGGDWAADFWTDNNAPGLGNTCGVSIYVKARIISVPGGQTAEEMKAEVLEQGYACASHVYNDGGYMQKIGFYARCDTTWYYLGWVLYAHLDSMVLNVGDKFDPTNARIGTAFQGGQTGTCWGSCHMHLEFDNVNGTSCYNVLPPTSGIAVNGRIGIIGGNLTDNHCPEISRTDCIASVPTTHWKGEYYNNPDLKGIPLMTRDDCESFLNFDWGMESPSMDCRIGIDNFSVRWQRTVSFKQTGFYQFKVVCDDGFRLYVDGTKHLDRWFDHSESATYTVEVPLKAGFHKIILEYYNHNGPAVAKLNWNFERNNPLAFAPWPTYGQNLQHTGQSQYEGPVNPVLKWSKFMGKRYLALPAVGMDGTIYLGSTYENDLYAINPNGLLKWTFTASKSMDETPTIGSDGTLYVGSWDGNLYAITENGAKKWSFPTGNALFSSPAIGYDGTLFVTSADCTLYAINNNGSLKWAYNTHRRIFNSSPAIAPDGTVYVSTGTIAYAFNSSGTLLWEKVLRGTGFGNFYSTPVVGIDGTIYIVAGGEFHALNPDGTTKWIFDAEKSVESLPAIGSDGTIYLHTTPAGPDDSIISGITNTPFNSKIYHPENMAGHKLYALNPDGTLKWFYPSYFQGIAIGADGTIYAGSDSLYAFNSDGGIKWKWAYSTVGGTYRPIIGTDKAIYYSASELQPDLTYKRYLRAIGSAPGPVATWTVFRHNLQHTGRSLFRGPERPALERTINLNYPIHSSPTVDINGTIYIGMSSPESSGQNDLATISTSDQNAYNKLYAVDTTGAIKWEFTANGPISTSAALGPDQTIYIGSDDARLYAIHPDGSLKWSFITGGAIKSSAVVGMDANIYVGSDDGKLYSVNAYGLGNWEFLTEGSIRSSPAVGFDGTIYVGSLDTKLYAVNSDGTSKWSYTTNGELVSSPAIGSNGSIYVGSYDAKLYAINADGNEKWVYQTGDSIISSPAIATNGTIYFGSTDNKLYAVKPDGALLWEFNTHAPIISSPAIDLNGIIYVGSKDDSLYAINADGTLNWVFGTGGSITSSPTLAANGAIYVGSWDNYLYFIGEKSKVSLADTPWPMFHHDEKHTGQSSFVGPEEPNMKWSFTARSWVQSSPAIGSDGTIYVGSSDFNLYALKPDGQIKWKFGTGSFIDSSPAIDSEGTIYLGSADSSLYAVNANGTVKWSYDTEGSISSSPTISAGVIYISSDAHIYAVYSDGTIKWTFEMSDAASTSPAVDSHGIIYAGSRDGQLYAIAPDGMLKWTYATDAPVASYPTIDLDGTIYIGSEDHKVYAINPNGTLKWTFETGDTIASTPAVGEDGTIYVGSFDHKLYAIYSNGTLKWSFATEDIIWGSSPAIDANGTIYIGSFDKNLYAVNNDGSLKWVFSSQGQIFSSPVIDKDGTIYFGSKDNKLYAIDEAIPNSVEHLSQIPAEYALYQNYPNPFNPATGIKYALPEMTKVELVVFNILGQKVRTLVDEEQRAGIYSIQWNGSNDYGLPMATGIYIVRFHASEITKSIKMLLLK